MKIVRDHIALVELKEMAKNGFGPFVKSVVDIDRNLMAVDGEMHADEEQMLLSDGSQQKNLWGINIYPDLPPAEMIEFDSMINIRPAQGNTSRSVENSAIQDAIRTLVHKIIT